MTFRLPLCLGMAAWAFCSPAWAAGDVAYCLRPQVRVEVSRLDGSPQHLNVPSDLARYYPDRAYRLGVGGMAIVVCGRVPEGLDCVVQEATPADMGFEASVRLPRLFVRWVADKATFRVDYTILSPGDCYEPFTRAPDLRLQEIRVR